MFPKFQRFVRRRVGKSATGKMVMHNSDSNQTVTYARHNAGVASPGIGALTTHHGQDELAVRNPAPNASQPSAPSGTYREYRTSV